MLRVLDLFSGIGGFSLGLERTGGFETVAFCEIEPFCRKVLAKHWPKVRQYDDVRTLTADTLRRDGIAVDVICGGFPCQDISFAGRGAGIEGERSGLWAEYARIVGELRPVFVIVENVAALLGRGLDRVLGDLASLGYDAEWHCIPASAVGAPHRRDRLWIMGNAGKPTGEWNARTISGTETRERGERQFDGHLPLGFGHAGEGCGSRLVAYPDNTGPQGWQGNGVDVAEHEKPLGPSGASVADATSQRQQGSGQPIFRCGQEPEGKRQTIILEPGCLGGIWSAEPDVGRVANGVPSRVDRLRSLGNAVVPQIPELIGNAILASMREAA